MAVMMTARGAMHNMSFILVFRQVDYERFIHIVNIKISRTRQQTKKNHQILLILSKNKI